MRPKSKIICPKCKQVGGSLKKKFESMPVHIPRFEKITNLSTGWDYAAKVLLRLRENLILFPPDRSSDEEIATALYDHFSEFTQHSKEELKKFELKHMSAPCKSIKNRMSYFASRSKEPREPSFADGTPKRKKSDPIHLTLPTDSGTIGKASVACLYGAIVCCTLRDFSILVQQPFSKNQNQGFAYGIYAFYRLFERDTRHSVSFTQKIKTLADIQNYGSHGAARINAVPTSHCLYCGKRGKGKNVQMKESEESPTGWKCPQCGSIEPKSVPFSSKHLHDIEIETLEKLTFIVECLPLYFESIIPMYKFSIQNGPNVRQDFFKSFQDHEMDATKDLLFKRERWVIRHYDPKRKSKKKECPIPALFASYIHYTMNS